MEIHIIWAQDINGGIGEKGKLPWYISKDLKNFKELTINSTIIMGRKTWDSLPIKPLPKRRNIVLTRSMHVNVEAYRSYKDCVKTLEKDKVDRVFIIGGRSIYKLFYKDAKFLHITNVAILKKGRLEKISKCNEDWCKVKSDGYKGWIKKESLWGLL